MDQFDTLEKFVSSRFFRGSGPGRIFVPQICWIRDADGALRMNFVGRVESLDADIAFVLGKLNLPAPRQPIRKRNVSRGDHSIVNAELVSGPVVDAIRSRYAEDFEAFGYSPEPDEQLASAD